MDLSSIFAKYSLRLDLARQVPEGLAGASLGHSDQVLSVDRNRPRLRLLNHARTPALSASLTLEVTQGQILSHSPAYATRFWWHLYGI